MPQVFKIGNYTVYFWSNEGEPLEPIHVHVADGIPRRDATKIWITESGKAFVVDWKADIPTSAQKNILRMIEANSKIIIDKWNEHFGEARYYC